jgi:hypothetical protein
LIPLWLHFLRRKSLRLSCQNLIDQRNQLLNFAVTHWRCLPVYFPRCPRADILKRGPNVS